MDLSCVVPDTTRRASGLLGQTPIKRTRRLFLLLAIPVALLVMATARELVPVVALLALWLWWQQSCHHQRMPWWGDPAEFALVLVAGLTAGAHDTVPLVLVGVLFRSLFTGPLRTAVGIAGYTAAHTLAAAVGPGEHAVSDALAMVPFLVLAGGVMYAFAQSLLRYDALQRRRAAADVEHLAYHDQVTGLANRARLEQRLGEALAPRTGDGTGAGLLLLDLDGFKQVNDSLGPAAGDRLLQAVAERLRAALGTGELLARLGADEFAVLLPGGAAGDEAGALTRAETLLAALGEPVALDARTVRVAATAGVWTSTPGASATAGEALTGADLALARAKQTARGNAVAYRPEMHVEARALLQLEHELREAIERDELVPHFQPLYRRDGVAIGAEALVRWEHPTRGLLGPGAFLDLAERTGLIVPIGRQILRRACTLAAGWGAEHAEAAEVGVGVNVAAAQLADPGFCADVERVLADTGLHPNRLILELTESAMMADMDGAVATLGRLREVGVRIAIDDFGTGYSSLAYLHRLPLDYLKIPREFVATLDAGDDRDGARELTRVIAELAHSLGLRVVAEGVETPAQQAAVDAIGCFLVQGFLHSRPVPADEIEAVVARSSTGSNRRVASAAARR